MMIALADHLWQSTAFAGLAALLALALKQNHARVRYWLWFIASIKFLIPLSLLFAIGGEFRSSPTAPKAPPVVSAAMIEISQPFTSGPAPQVTAHGNPIPSILFAVWLCGFAAVTFGWARKWRRVQAAVRGASPLPLQVPVPVLSSPALLEPGVFGIFRPVLLLPEGILSHLTPAHLQAILAHELCHVRRRDNLAAAIHMAVEAIFWFHPLVWWLGARLLEERERACDEEVVRLGNEPQVYAESILKTCEFCLESALPCVSGITGSDLKQRIVRIMSESFSTRLGFGRRLLLSSAAIAAVAGPVLVGLAQSSTPLPSFEVASVKPNRSAGSNVSITLQPGGRFNAQNLTLKFLIEFAYNIKTPQISGGPNWINSDHFDVEAKAEEGALKHLGQEEQLNQMRLMMQSMLADRFKLTVRHESKELPVFALVVAKNGPKLRAAKDIDEYAKVRNAKMAAEPGPAPRGGIWASRGGITLTSATMPMLAAVLSRQVGRPVIDKTGLSGSYDCELKWTPDPSEGPLPPGPDAPPPLPSSGPALFTALLEQLGLKLESQKGPVKTLVIDHAEKPTGN